MFSMIIHAKIVFHIYTPTSSVLSLTLKLLRLSPKCTRLLNAQMEKFHFLLIHSPLLNIKMPNRKVVIHSHI